MISSYIQEADKQVSKGEDKRLYVKNKVKNKKEVSKVSNQRLNAAIELIVLFKRL